MPTSAPGSSRKDIVQPRVMRAAPGGFTLLELLIVLMIIAVSVSVVALSVRDGDATRLDEEAMRLSVLLEQARSESRVTGATVRWVPSGDARPAADGTPAAQFNFVGLPASQPMPTRWLDPATTAQVVGGTTLLLGPQAILPPQRVVLRLGERRLDLVTDGLRPFAVADDTVAGQP